MATHQQIGGMSDQQLLERMVERYPTRFDTEYWNFFTANVGRHLPSEPTIADLGCGPGLYLSDLSERHRDARLYGFDLTPAMIEHATRLPFADRPPTLAVNDVATDRLPLEDESAHLVCMTALLHLLDDPFPVLEEVRRVLRRDGFFLLDDWIRTPLAEYLASRPRGRGDDLRQSRRSWLGLFPYHNKYTVEDWKWLLSEAGFSLVTTIKLREHTQIFLAGKG